eukprot:TRINITY_DN2198_c0_g3_i3.p1 TRINITY_DN2198_c0_g3~~TRINITY_DN2198_c0_g3_i3.p1  ORF type:complete len:452 (-),score=48.95 TRINITY_DN2198_c0_g3_i3:82-1407(-)
MDSLSVYNDAFGGTDQQVQFIRSVGHRWRLSVPFRNILMELHGHPRGIDLLLLSTINEAFVSTPSPGHYLEFDSLNFNKVRFGLEGMIARRYGCSKEPMSIDVIRKILEVVISQSTIVYNTVISGGSSLTWKRAYETGLLFFTSIDAHTKTATVMVPNWWCMLYARHCGVAISPVLDSDASQYWQQFELFVSEYLALRSLVCDSLQQLLHGSLSTCEERCETWKMKPCFGCVISMIQLPSEKNLTQIPTSKGLIRLDKMPSYFVFKNAKGAASDSVLPMCCTSQETGENSTLYVQYKNWEALNAGEPSYLTNKTLNTERGKAIVEHEKINKQWGKFFFLLVSSQPLDVSFSVDSIPADCAVVGPAQFDSFFGPFSRRAHFCLSTKVNLNCDPVSALQLRGVGRVHALEIVAERSRECFVSLADVESRLPWHPKFDSNMVGL